MSVRPVSRTGVSAKSISGSTGKENAGASEIQALVSHHFSISEDDLKGPSRMRKLADPRHIAMYMCKQLTDLSFPEIAARFGGRDHTAMDFVHR